jgi:hypothetical protein
MIKAIDAQQVVFQIEHAAKVQQQHPEVQQRYLQIQTQEEKKLMREKIKNSEETNRARIRKDEERDKRRNEGENTEKGKEDLSDSNEESGQKVRQNTGHINITV